MVCKVRKASMTDHANALADGDGRLFTLANTVALLMFNTHGSPASLSISQKVLAEHGANLLKAYKETVVEPAMVEVAKRAFEARQQVAAHLVAECWQDLLDKDDRNSPAEYPDMCLITRKELAEFLGRAPQPDTVTEEQVQAAIKAVDDWGYPYRIPVGAMRAALSARGNA